MIKGKQKAWMGAVVSAVIFGGYHYLFGESPPGASTEEMLTQIAEVLIAALLGGGATGAAVYAKSNNV